MSKRIDLDFKITRAELDISDTETVYRYDVLIKQLPVYIISIFTSNRDATLFLKNSLENDVLANAIINYKTSWVISNGTPKGEELIDEEGTGRNIHGILIMIDVDTIEDIRDEFNEAAYEDIGEPGDTFMLKSALPDIIEIIYRDKGRI